MAHCSKPVLGVLPSVLLAQTGHFAAPAGFKLPVDANDSSITRTVLVSGGRRAVTCRGAFFWKAFFKIRAQPLTALDASGQVRSGQVRYITDLT